MNYKEVFDQTQAYLQARDYGWVAQQVAEELATGKLSPERIDTLTETDDRQSSIIANGDFKRAQPAEFVRRSEYSDKEALIILLEAVRRAIFEISSIVDDISEYFTLDGMTAIRFEPQEAGGFNLPAWSAEENPAQARNALRMQFDLIIDELRNT